MNCNARGALIVRRSAKTSGIAWKNEVNEAARCANTKRPLTHSLDLSEEGLAMQATRPCSVDDCDRDHAARGLCLPHYKRLRKWGDPLIVRPVRPPIDRFAEKVALTDSGCLEWTGLRNEWGYGLFSADGRRWLAHRWSYEYAMGPLGGLLACHHCDNPCCVHPEHLYGGTHADNTRDMVERGRAAGKYSGKTHCAHDHEFTPQNTSLKRLKNGRYERVCRKCRHRRNVEQAARRKVARQETKESVNVG